MPSRHHRAVTAGRARRFEFFLKEVLDCEDRKNPPSSGKGDKIEPQRAQNGYPHSSTRGSVARQTGRLGKLTPCKAKNRSSGKIPLQVATAAVPIILLVPATSLTRRNRNQTDPNTESWSLPKSTPKAYQHWLRRIPRKISRQKRAESRC